MSCRSMLSMTQLAFESRSTTPSAGLELELGGEEPAADTPVVKPPTVRPSGSVTIRFKLTGVSQESESTAAGGARLGTQAFRLSGTGVSTHSGRSYCVPLEPFPPIAEKRRS